MWDFVGGYILEVGVWKMIKRIIGMVMVAICIMLAYTPTTCHAETKGTVSGSAVAGGGDSYLQEDMQDISTKGLFKVYIVGLGSGFGLCSIVYFIGLGVGFGYSLLKKHM